MIRVREASVLFVALLGTCAVMETMSLNQQQEVACVSNSEAASLTGGQTSAGCSNYMSTVQCPPSVQNCNGMNIPCDVYVLLSDGTGVSAKNVVQYSTTKACGYTCGKCGKQCGCFDRYTTYDPCGP